MHGQAVTFTATVSVVSPGSTAVAYPTGTVTFYDNGTSIGTGTLSVVGGQDQATLTTSYAEHGHVISITAAYTSGDGNFNASPVSTAISQVVNKDNTTTTASSIAELRERRPDRHLHGDGHRQFAGFGHAHREPSTSTTQRPAPT